MRKNTFCDYGHYGHKTTGKVRKLSTSEGGAYLCKTHWEKEMAWRKERNKTLTGKAKFPIRKFPA